MWTKSQIKTVVASKKFAIAAASVASFASGAAGSYFFLNKRLEAKWQEIFEQELKAAKYFHDKRNKTGEFADPSALVAEYKEAEDPVVNGQADMLREAVEILDQQSYTHYNKGPQSQEEAVEVKGSIKKNIFDNPPPAERTEYDEDIEAAKRNAGKPYIITMEEYMANDSRYSQINLTYYEDDVLANEMDIPVEDERVIIGEDNLHFGCGSRDPNIVYIRNEDREEEFEIVRSRGTFDQEVAGGLSHSDGPRRFRNED